MTETATQGQGAGNGGGAPPEEGQAEGWRPNSGDRIVGKVVDIAATDMGYGVYPIVTLRRDDGSETAVHAFHTVLRRELARRRPQIGDELDITYLGKKGEGGSFGRGYDNYKVRSDKDVSGYDWSRDLADSDAEPIARSDEPPIEPGAVPDAPPPENPSNWGSGTLGEEARAQEREEHLDTQYGDKPPF